MGNGPRTTAIVAFILASCLFLAACPPLPPSDAAVIYVKPSSIWGGGDGSTAMKAVSGLAAALAYPKAGRTFVLLSGTYTGESAFLSGVDCSEAQMTIVAAEPGRAILDGNGIGWSALTLTNCRGIRIKGLALAGYGECGVSILGCEGVSIEDCSILDCGFASSGTFPDRPFAGIQVAASRGVALLGNTIRRIGRISPQSGNAAYGILADSLVDGRIEGNEASDNSAGGIVATDCESLSLSGNAISGHGGSIALPAGSWFVGGLLLDGGRNLSVTANRISGNKTGMSLGNGRLRPVADWAIVDNEISTNQVGISISGFGPTLPAGIALSGNQLSGNGTDQDLDDAVHWRQASSPVDSTLIMNSLALHVDPVGWLSEDDQAGTLLFRAWAAAGQDWEYLDVILPVSRDSEDALSVGSGPFELRLLRGRRLYLATGGMADGLLSATVDIDALTIELGFSQVRLLAWGTAWLDGVTLEGSLSFDL